MLSELPHLRRAFNVGADCPAVSCSRTHSGYLAGGKFRWKTSPGWSTVLTGLDNRSHKVYNNDPESTKRLWTQNTFVKHAHARRKRTAYFGRPSVVGHRDRLGLLDGTPSEWHGSEHNDDMDGDRKLTTQACQAMEAGAECVFLHLDMTDVMGHRFGFHGPAYTYALHHHDTMMKQLWQTLDKTPDDWLVVVCADHGAHGKIHGTRLDTDTQSPVWFSRALRPPPGQPMGHTLIPDADPKVPHQMDVAPTVCRWLRISTIGDGRAWRLP